MVKNPMRFDRTLNIQENKPKKIGIENKESWVNVGGARKCSFKFDSGSEYNTQFADRVLLTATVRMQFDPTISEKMRIVMLSKFIEGKEEAFKILAVMPAIYNGRRITQLKVQRWAAL